MLIKKKQSLLRKKKKSLRRKKKKKGLKKLFLIKPNQKINYKDINLLSLFLTKQGKIIPKSVSQVTPQQQRKLSKAIKNARILSLLPFITSNFR